LKILAVDSCGGAATCALAVDGKLTAEIVLNDKKTHSVKLLPQIAHMLDAADTDIFDIDYFAAAVGPGSFTGQRIGVAAVKGLAHAAGKPCIAVSSLAALAYNLGATPYLVCPMIDARREQVYTATFQGAERLTEDRAMPLADLPDELGGRVTVFVGDGAVAFRDKITARMGDKAIFPPLHLIFPRGGSVAALAEQYARENKTCDYHTLQPLYLRRPQAEREYLERRGPK
jgi:tRNA threonylcarbamoyladenosine biosynthesis protein TsaB